MFMKLHRLTLALIVSTISFFAFPRTFIYKGAMTFGSAANITNLPIYFKGDIYFASSEQANNANNMACFVFQSAPLTSLYILITEHPPLPSNIESECLSTPIKGAYKLYKARKKTTLNHRNILQYKWRIIDITKSYSSDKLPEATIIILTHPVNVELIESQTWTQETHIVPLPTICFKKAILQQELQDLIFEMQIALMDLKITHKQPQQDTKILDEKRIVCAPVTTKTRTS